MAATSSASSFLATTAPHCNYTLRKNPLPATATATALSLNPPKTLSLSAASSSSVSAASKPSRKPLQASSYVEGREGIWSLRDDLVGMSGVRADGKPKEKGPPPMVFDRFQGVIDQLFHHRIIRVGGPVEDDVANIVVSQLLYLDALDPTKDIVMYINSPGGSVTAGMAIFDTMKHIRANVSTVCVGLAASMAAFLLATGSTGKRYSLPNARIMIHQPIGGAQGSQSDMEIQVNEVLHHRAVLSGYLAYHTGQPLEKILKDTDRDFFMSAKEAKEYGLIDDIITNPLKALQNQPVSN